MSKEYKTRHPRCPKGHFISWSTYRLVTTTDETGNPLEDKNTFFCKVCNQLVTEQEQEYHGYNIEHLAF